MTEERAYKIVYIKATVPGTTLDDCREYIDADPVGALDGAEYSFKRGKLSDGGDGLRNEAELEATVARLEQDNKRLRHLDSMPVDALRRYYRGTVYTPTAAQRYDYMPDDYDTDSVAIYRWLFPQDGAA